VFLSSNPNGNPFANLGLLIGTYSFNGLNSKNKGFVFTLSVYNPIAYRLSCVYKCCCRWWKRCGLLVVFMQSSYTSPSKCKCSSPFGNLVSCSLLTSCLYSLNYFSYGDVIYDTSYLDSHNYPSCGGVIYGTFVICLIAYTIVGTTDGSTLPLIIFYALAFVISCSFFKLQLEAPPS
jgi:hypothetical protein